MKEREVKGQFNVAIAMETKAKLSQSGPRSSHKASPARLVLRIKNNTLLKTFILITDFSSLLFLPRIPSVSEDPHDVLNPSLHFFPPSTPAQEPTSPPQRPPQVWDSLLSNKLTLIFGKSSRSHAV